MTHPGSKCPPALGRRPAPPGPESARWQPAWTSRAACWHTRRGRQWRRRCKQTGSGSVVSYAQMKSNAVRGPRPKARPVATPTPITMYLDVSFWQREAESHLGQPVRAFPRARSRTRPGVRRRHHCGKLASFDAANVMSEHPSIDEIVADPEMRSTEHRPASRWMRAALIAALALGVLAATWWWLSRSTAPVEQPATATPTASPAPGPNCESGTWPGGIGRPCGRPATANNGPRSKRGGRLPALGESDLVFARWLEDIFGREGWTSCASTTSHAASSPPSTTSAVSRRQRDFGRSTPPRADSAQQVATDGR